PRYTLSIIAKESGPVILTMPIPELLIPVEIAAMVPEYGSFMGIPPRVVSLNVLIIRFLLLIVNLDGHIFPVYTDMEEKECVIYEEKSSSDRAWTSWSPCDGDPRHQRDRQRTGWH